VKQFILLVIAIFTLISCSSEHSDKTKLKTSLPILTTITGEHIDFNHLKRQWVVINYWANWCEPCKKEIPELNTFAKMHDNVYMVGVNYDGVDNHRLLELIAKNEIHYFNSVTDPNQSLQLGDIPGLPVTFVFNQKGKLRKTLFGPQTAKTLEKSLK
jgi:thiol-disulfide isomerase/thioredoxin